MAKRKVSTEEAGEKKARHRDFSVEDIVEKLHDYHQTIGVHRIKWMVDFCVRETKVPPTSLSGPVLRSEPGILGDLAMWFDGRNSDYPRSVIPEYTDIIEYSGARESVFFEDEATQTDWRFLQRLGRMVQAALDVSPIEEGILGDVVVWLSSLPLNGLDVRWIQSRFPFGEGSVVDRIRRVHWDPSGSSQLNRCRHPGCLKDLGLPESSTSVPHSTLVEKSQRWAENIKASVEGATENYLNRGLPPQNSPVIFHKRTMAVLSVGNTKFWFQAFYPTRLSIRGQVFCLNVSENVVLAQHPRLASAVDLPEEVIKVLENSAGAKGFTPVYSMTGPYVVGSESFPDKWVSPEKTLLCIQGRVRWTDVDCDPVSEPQSMAVRVNGDSGTVIVEVKVLASKNPGIEEAYLGPAGFFRNMTVSDRMHCQDPTLLHQADRFFPECLPISLVKIVLSYVHVRLPFCENRVTYFIRKYSESES
jgi:hypothetical protein